MKARGVLSQHSSSKGYLSLIPFAIHYDSHPEKLSRQLPNTLAWEFLEHHPHPAMLPPVGLVSLALPGTLVAQGGNTCPSSAGGALAFSPQLSIQVSAARPLKPILRLRRFFSPEARKRYSQWPGASAAHLVKA